MSHRLPGGGRLIDRGRSCNFTFDGHVLQGYVGDTLASALLGAGRVMVGRSFKYHRPRGIIASGAEEPNALVNLGEGPRHEPDQRATTTELFEGLAARSQNVWPSLSFDIGAVNGLFARFLTAGFYYKMFIHPRAFWKHLYEPVIRQSAGLGRAPREADPDRYELLYAFADVAVIGGGIAGLQAARQAAEAGLRVLLFEQTPHWGGRAPVDGAQIDGQPAGEWVNSTVEWLEKQENVTMRTRCMGAGVYDHGYLLAQERLSDHQPGAEGPRHRLWRIRARRILTATGAIERPLSFAGNDVPGVMLASAMRDYLVNWAVAPGRRVVIVTNNDDAYRTAIALHEAGIEVPAIVDARAEVRGALPDRARALGLTIREGMAIDKVQGRAQVRGVTLCRHAGAGGAVAARIECDAVAMSGGWSPVVHLWSHCGGKLTWDAAQAHFRPDPARGPTDHDGAVFVQAAGAANGALAADAVLRDADTAARRVLADLDADAGQLPAAPQADSAPEAPLLPVWMMPEEAGYAHRSKMWLDFQNDVKVSDVQLAAREGYRSVEHTKRYTTLGMATDQGKLSNINGLGVLSQELGENIPDVGTTTFRPPYTPLTFGAITGEAKGALFQPLRRTPIDAWHEARGASWEPVGQWRRPYAYPRAGESRASAVTREVNNTRQHLGLLDASTLGKLLVSGPDAPRFLDMLYTGMMSSLKPGRCRYGLMCNENGFLMDDGVVARLDAQSFLCHTTSGGAEHIHGWMEDWLQCEWWDWKVHVINQTEQFAQIAVVGPNARKVLEKLGGMDLSAEALPFMGWAEGRLGGVDVRVYRISFSGELSYEIAVPAGQGLALWEAIFEAGQAFDVLPYGTEALHVMRAEKGFIMIGDETDGTVIPQDLGLDWAISKKKADFLGKRGMMRSHLQSPERWKLVGLETLDGSVLPHAALAVRPGQNTNGQRLTEGRVTSSYHSPTLGRGIALGLVHRGPERIGEVLNFAGDKGQEEIRARIVSPVFFDPEGERQNV
ncbi:sarcosine oxidase subunit alpha family protein [Alkalilacustris brevis]|uniref:sarcosine oxidase subunit alpha family protein n=1 Tax=Alkalilacustris brevis TaxID=2026338 RepID=UPI000E0D68AB|nr:sarcosine oxidase subunit alpha family protein [Alkalilacustris brevis]